MSIPSSSAKQSQICVTDSGKPAPLRQSANLIDLDDKSSVRVSILEAFDPLLIASESGSNRTLSPDCSGNRIAQYIDLHSIFLHLYFSLLQHSFKYCINFLVEDATSVCGSVYDEYDPYDFIYSGSGSNSLSDSMYTAVIKTESAPQSPPPLPPRAKFATIERRKQSRETLVIFFYKLHVAKHSILILFIYIYMVCFVHFQSTEKLKLYENVVKVDRKRTPHDADLKSFFRMVQNLRSK